MIIFCEECGERYIIEDGEIADKEKVFTCRVCKDVIRVPALEISGKSDTKEKNDSEKNQRL